MPKKTTVKNFYRALLASAYVAGASAAGLALAGPAGAAAAGKAATASLASPVGVAAVELGAETATEYAVESEKMATGGLVTEPTFAMIGEAGPELVLPLMGAPALKKKRKKTKADRNLSKALKEANSRLRTKSGKLRKGKTQRDVMRLAHRLRRKM